MKQHDREVKRIVTYSDPAGAYIRGWLFIVVIIFSILCAVSMICFPYVYRSPIPLWFALIWEFSPFIWALSDNEYTLNALARVTISSQGLRCAFLGRKVKTILWEDIQYCTASFWNTTQGSFTKPGAPLTIMSFSPVMN